MDKFKKSMGPVLKRLKKDKSLKLILIVLILLFVGMIALSKFTKIRQEKIDAKEQDPVTVSKSGETTGEPVRGLHRNELEDDNYYIYHNGLYYLVNGDGIGLNYTPSDDDYNGSSSYRVSMMLEDDFANIPVLYMGQGDKLCYFSQYGNMSYIKLERYSDIGTSIGAFNFYADDHNGYYYLNIEKPDENEDMTTFSSSSAGSLLNAAYLSDGEERKDNTKKDDDNSLTALTITDIGGMELARKNLCSVGIIKGLEKDKTYDMSVYNGTNYTNFKVTADTHYLTGMEMFAISDVPLDKDLGVQEIVLPDYLLNGYYLVDNYGFIRLCQGKSYDKDEDVNVRLLETNEEGTAYEDGVDGNGDTVSEDPDALEEEAGKKFEDEVTTAMYSDDPALNMYTALIPGSFGYETEEERLQKQQERIKALQDKEGVVDTETPESSKDYSDAPFDVNQGFAAQQTVDTLVLDNDFLYYSTGNRNLTVLKVDHATRLLTGRMEETEAGYTYTKLSEDEAPIQKTDLIAFQMDKEICIMRVKEDPVQTEGGIVLSLEDASSTAETILKSDSISLTKDDVDAYNNIHQDTGKTSARSQRKRG